MSFRARVSTAVCVVLALLFGSAPVQAASSQDALPQFDGHAGAVQRQGSTMMAPEGTNDPRCTADEIVVLVHGTDATFYADYALIGETLARSGGAFTELTTATAKTHTGGPRLSTPPRRSTGW